MTNIYVGCTMPTTRYCCIVCARVEWRAIESSRLCKIICHRLVVNQIAKTRDGAIEIGCNSSYMISPCCKNYTHRSTNPNRTISIHQGSRTRRVLLAPSHKALGQLTQTAQIKLIIRIQIHQPLPRQPACRAIERALVQTLRTRPSALDNSRCHRQSVIAVIRIRFLHVINDATEQRVVVVADIFAFAVAETRLGTGHDLGGWDDLRAVFVCDERFGEDEELETHADLRYVLGYRKTRISAEGIGGGECGKELLVAHEVPETRVDAIANLCGFA